MSKEEKNRRKTAQMQMLIQEIPLLSQEGSRWGIGVMTNNDYMMQ